jgi:hypothetical protein
MLDEQTRSGLTNYLDVMKDIEKNRIQERNHSKILEKANENILTGNVGTGYGSFAEKRLNGLKDLAKDMLKTKGLSEEDRKFCEKLTNLTPESEKSLKEKLENPNSFKNFDELKSAVSTLHEKQKKAPEQKTTETPEQKTTETPIQALNDDTEFDALSEFIDEYTPYSETPLNQPQAKKVQQTQVVNQQDSQTQNVSQVPNSLNRMISKTKSQTSQSVIDAKPKVTSITREASGNIIYKSSGGKIVVLNQEKASQMAKQVLKAQEHDKNSDDIPDDLQVVDPSQIKIDFKKQISAPAVQGGSGQVQQKARQ